jgi:hypothetical protein
MPGHKKSHHKKKHHVNESASPHSEEADVSDLRVETSSSQEKDSSSEKNNGQSVSHAASSDEADAFASANSTPRHPSGPVSREGSLSPRSMSPRVAGL